MDERHSERPIVVLKTHIRRDPMDVRLVSRHALDRDEAVGAFIAAVDSPVFGIGVHSLIGVFNAQRRKGEGDRRIYSLITPSSDGREAGVWIQDQV